MKAKPVLFLLAAVAFHAGLLLFGGLLLFHPVKAKGPAAEDVDIAVDGPKKEEVKDEKDLADQKETPPETVTPELKEAAPAEAAPLGLDQLEMALDPGMGGGGGDFGGAIARLGGGGNRAAADEAGAAAESVFSIADLDQAPRVVYQPAPEYPNELRHKKIAGTVYLLFLVDQGGRVTTPIVQKSTNPAFERPALQAVKRWRFEPGKHNGQTVQFRMRVPITFANA